MARLIYNNQGGLLGADPGISGTTITFAVAPNFSTLTSTDYIPLVLDAGTTRFEIVYLTSYTAGALTGTILRSAEDASRWPSVAHPNGTWSCAPTAVSFNPEISRVTLVATPSLPNSVWTKVPWDTITFDYNNNFSTVTSGYTVPVPGIYQVNALLAFNIQNNPQNIQASIWKNGAAAAGNSTQNFRGYTSGDIQSLTMFDYLRCITGDVLTIYMYNGQTNSVPMYGGVGDVMNARFERVA